ncbi:MAG: hypothetical protein JRN35_09010 [Nitrososphaerota archaeon]|nr:hypothetical protein [Nitrososphaerota archaeon]
MVLPPGFVRYWEGKGLQRPYCFECLHFAHEKFTARGICWEYGAYVSLHSSCAAFEKKTNSSTPILDEGQIRVSHPSGLKDLLT